MAKVIRKTKISWKLGDDTIVAFDNFQATIYSTYNLLNRRPFDQMKQQILVSGPEEYNSWVEVINLAMEKGLIGYGTRIPDLEES